jgi:hypothetical protein
VRCEVTGRPVGGVDGCLAVPVGVAQRPGRLAQEKARSAGRISLVSGGLQPAAAGEVESGEGENSEGESQRGKVAGFSDEPSE